jgi:predicted transcriptional regulator
METIKKDDDKDKENKALKELWDLLQAGLDDIENGRTLTEEEMDKALESM